METSDGGGIGLDCRVGNIVWVRRRNGSWWPGRILGLDELSESHVMSPRSGTPVKLLGREDASVDWYNLEKSKRVKAFRCGEFDACIERAEASQSIPFKKREKYARREDAILHALELEKKKNFGINTNGISSKATCSKAIGAYKREPITLSSPEIYVRDDEPVAHGKLSSYKCENLLKKVVFSHEGDVIDDPLYLHRQRGNQQFSLEHDNAEAIPRMRGLQDIGLRTTQSKRKPSLSSSWEYTCKSIDNHVDSVSSSGYIMEGADQVSTSRNEIAAKRKRSYDTVVDEFLVKKRDRRRPLVQVLESSAKLPPFSSQPSCSTTGNPKTEETDKMASPWRAKRSRCIYLPADLDDHPEHGGCTSEHMLSSTNQFEMCNDINYAGNVAEGCTSSCLIEVTGSDCCKGDLLEPDMIEETDMLIDSTDILLQRSKNCDPSEFQVSARFSSLIQEDVPLSGFLSQLHGQAKDASSEARVSKWRLKGKRNIRNVGKRLIDSGDVKTCFPDSENCNGSINSTYESKGTLKFGRAETSSQRIPGRGFYPIKEEFEYAHNDNDLVDKDLDQNQLTLYGNMTIPVQSTKHHGRSHCSLNDSDEDSHALNPSIWEPSNLTCNAFWEEPIELFDRVPHPCNEMEPLLVDVDVKVQTSYQGEHVPLVSLMSRLNGKAIIGHPIQIEILEDGSANHLIFAHCAVIDESTAPQAMWRTARRTAMQRVPRSIPLISSLEEEDPDLFHKPPLHKEAYYHYLKHQVRPAKKRASLVHQAGLRKFQKKNPKRFNLSSKKTRTLSSLASDDKLGGERDGLGGLIKTDDTVPPVTCVPVKVVFSRILEAVGRPSSAVAHRVRMSSPRRTQGP